MAARAHGVLLDDAVVQKGAQHNRMSEKVRGISGEAFAPLKVDSRQGEASGGCTVEYIDHILCRGSHLSNVQMCGGNDSEAFVTITRTWSIFTRSNSTLRWPHSLVRSSSPVQRFPKCVCHILTVCLNFFVSVGWCCSFPKEFEYPLT
jgi:hypothetical protein